MKRIRTPLIILLSIFGTITVCVVVLAGVFGFMYLKGLGLLLEDKLVESLDNPYINQNFEGWKRVTINNDFSVEIPDNLDIKYDNNRIRIELKNAQTVEGVFVNASAVDTMDTYSEYVEYRNEIARGAFRSYYSTNLGVPVDYGIATVENTDGSISRYYRLIIHGASDRNGKRGYYEFNFPADDASKDNDIIDALEAIAYSYRCP